MTNLEYWQERAKGNSTYGATTNDLNLKYLEETHIIDIINKYKTEGSIGIDVGCGNGISTAAYNTYIPMDGIDFSSNMIEDAKRRNSGVNFSVGDITKIETLPTKKYNIVMLTRCLQNVPLELQKTALDNIVNLCVPGGIVILCEYFEDYLSKLNALRVIFNLPIIPSTEYNYLPNSNFIQSNYNVVEHIDFAGSYYVLSRLYNAYEAVLEDRKCDYTDELNLRSLNFPSFPNVSPLQTFIIRK